MTKRLQPAGVYLALSPAHRELREATARDLATQIRQTRGDPRLSAWEEGFLASLDRQLRESEYHLGLSVPQWDKIWEIIDRLARCPDELTGFEEE